MRIRPPNVRSYPYDWLWLMRFCECNESNGEIEIDKWKKKPLHLYWVRITPFWSNTNEFWPIPIYCHTQHNITPKMHSTIKREKTKKKKTRIQFSSVHIISHTHTETNERAESTNGCETWSGRMSVFVYDSIFCICIGTMSKGS